MQAGSKSRELLPQTHNLWLPSPSPSLRDSLFPPMGERGRGEGEQGAPMLKNLRGRQASGVQTFRLLLGLGGCSHRDGVDWVVGCQWSGTRYVSCFQQNVGFAENTNFDVLFNNG